MSDQKIRKNHLLGCFEIALFMKEGFLRFDDSQKSFLQSFWVLGLNIPLLLLAIPFIYAAKEELQSDSMTFIAILFILKFVIFYAIGFIFIYYLCRFMKRSEHFKQYVTISNWSALIGIIAFIPLLALLHFTQKSYDDLYYAIIILSLYSYCYSAFIIRHVIKIPWELAIFITICFLAINETGFDLLYWISQ